MPTTEKELRIKLLRHLTRREHSREVVDGQPLLDLKGPGVSAEEIARWESVHVRFSKYDFFSIPKKYQAKRFFEGEAEGSKKNFCNNPLGLVRPKALHSVSNYAFENGIESSPNIYADDSSERGPEDDQIEESYLRTVRNFEDLNMIALGSLNEPDVQERRCVVKEALGIIFPQQDEQVMFSDDDLKKSELESEPGWLVYTVINLLDNPTDGITPTGRIRALELLEIYSGDELYQGFRGGKYEENNGYDKVRNRNNEEVKQLFVTDGQGEIDWTATFQKLHKIPPERSIQASLLLLHDYRMSDEVFEFWSSVSKFDETTKLKMFGDEATFRIYIF